MGYSYRYSDGTYLPLIDERPSTPQTAIYAVPWLETADRFTVAARKGDTAPFVLAHRENVLPGRPAYLPMSAPPSLQSPSAGAAVGADTTFSWEWSTPYGSQIFFVWHLRAANASQGLYVVTARKQLTWPALASELLPPGTDAVWSVETHVQLIGWDSIGPEPTDVDTATGPKGYLDQFALRRDAPRGPNVADGIFTESERRSLQVSP